MPIDAELLKIRRWAETSSNRDTPESVGIIRTDGWTVVYEQIGGKLPERKVFNQLIRELSIFSIDRIEYGILPWDSRVNYRHYAFVVGSDGVLYKSTESSGPGGFEVGENDPAGGGNSWRPY